MKKHLLVDCNNLIYRGYHTSQLTDDTGLRISGVFQGMKMLHKLIKRFQPNSVVCAWDENRCQGRMKLYPDYKGHRDKNRKEEDTKAIKRNIKIMQKILEHLPVKQIVVKDMEADDVIGYLSHRIKGNNIVVSNDHDFIQLVSKQTSVFLPLPNKILTHKNVGDFLEIDPDHFLLYKALLGDDSDNIKGIKGVGPVTAKKILNDNLPMNKEWMPIIDRNLQLMNIGYFMTKEQMAEINAQYTYQKYKKVNVNKVRRIFAKHNFQSLLFNFESFRYEFGRLRQKKR